MHTKMIGKKINQLATELAPVSTDLTIIGDPTTGVSKKITLAQLGAIFSGAVSFYTNFAGFPVTGDINVIYCAKDTQKLYLWSGSAYVEVFPSQALLDTYQLRSEKGNANGYASLDSQGKVPISQLPSSIMEYKGTWSAATNTPTLANGTGDTGDVYICNAAGTVNFGAGPITFAVGDYVIYSGTIWQRSSGAVGTVTSVAASITGNSLTISGSPVTTSGTLAFAFAGTGAQYIKGDGTLATFPSIISQAQNLVTEVYNSTGATLTKGTVVYINGGQGNLPTVTKAIATGDSTSAQTYGIVQNDITNNNNGYVVVAGRLSDIDTQAYTEGTQLYLSSTTAGAYTSTKQYAPAHLVYIGIIVRSHPTQGIIEVKIQNGYELDELHNVAAQTPTNNDGLFWESSTSLWKNKSIATILGGTPVIGSGTTNFVSKFTASSTIGSSQIWDNGTSVLIGTTGSLPGIKVGIYSSTQRALEVVSTNANALFVQSPAAYILTISNGTWTSQFTNTGRLDLAGDLLVNTIANATTDTDRFLVSDSGVIKYRTGAELLSDIGGQPSGTYVTSVGLSVPTGFAVSGSPVTSSGTLALAFDTGYSLPTIVKQNNWDTAYNTRIVTASSPLSFISNTISISQASGSANGFLSSTDWTTFNNKQNALTNPVTGTGTTNYLPKFTGTSTIGNSAIYQNGNYIGIGTTSPIISLQVRDAGNTYSGHFSGNDQVNGVAIGTLSSNVAIIQGYTRTFSAINDIVIQPSGGNLGLGVTPSAWGSSDKALQISSIGFFAAGSNVGTIVGSNAYFDGTSYKYLTNGYANMIQFGDGEYRFRTAPSGTAGNAISFTQAMTLDASGRLLVGTTSASGGRLDVVSGAGLNTYFNSTGTGIYLQIANNGSNLGYIGDGTTLLSGGGSTDFVIRSQAALAFSTGGNTERFRIASTGAATFSSSVTAGAFLTNASNGTAGQEGLRINNDNGYIGFFNGANNTRSGYLQGNTTDVTLTTSLSTPLIFGTANVEKMRITSGGNVGIGTTSPSAIISGSETTLNVKGNVAGAVGSIVARSSGFSNTTSIGIAAFDSINLTGIYVETNSPMAFWTNSTERMRITSGGNVGIGNTSPARNLTVSTSSESYVSVTGGSTSDVGYLFGTSSSDAKGRLIYNNTDNMQFWTASSERMRINSNGKLLLATTTSIANYSMDISGTNGAIWARCGNSGDAQFLSSSTSIGFHYYALTTATVYYVLTNGDVRNANNSYGAISDISIKENIVDATPKLNDLLKVKIRNYNLIADENKEKQIGVIAQELEQIFPNMISNDKQIGSDKTIKTVKYSVFVPMLIKAVQELKAELDTLKNK